MAKTLLDAVNETLKRENVIDTSNTGLLTSLSNSAVQHNIDIAVQVINEGIDELFNASDISMPLEGAESSITLVTGTREYSLAIDLVELQWPMTDRVNTQFITEWRGGYTDFLLLDPQQLYTGIPSYAMISPITGKLRLVWAPDTTTNGHIYFYQYQRDMAVAAATDTVPFNNEVFRCMVPVWAQLYKREMRNEFDEKLYDSAFGRASRCLTEEPWMDNYSPRP